MTRLVPLLLACPIVIAVAQPVAERRLGTPEATAPEPFTTVTGVRELRDGRVLIADGRERALQVVDLASGVVAPVGRQGAGPAEWGVPSRLHAMPGDSTLMEDFTNGRYLVILPDGRPGPTFRLPDHSPARAGTLVGVDPRGRLVITRERPGAAPREPSTGVVDVLAFDRAIGRTDTIAQLAVPRGERSGVRQHAGGMLQAFTNLPLAPRDAAAVSYDGGIAIARADGYRVEWIRSDGRRMAGPSGPAPRIRVTDAEKEAFMRSQIRPGAIVTSGPIGGGGGAVPRAAADLRAITDPDMTWPAEKPPFQANAVHVAPGGRLWVLRSRAHDDPVPAYDVFDADGRVVERVVLASHARVVGFGRGVVYVARSEDDDLQHLERHRLP